MVSEQPLKSVLRLPSTPLLKEWFQCSVSFPLGFRSILEMSYDSLVVLVGKSFIKMHAAQWAEYKTLLIPGPLCNQKHIAAGFVLCFPYDRLLLCSSPVWNCTGDRFQGVWVS